MKHITKIIIVLLLFPMLAQSDITVNVDKLDNLDKHIELEVTVCNKREKEKITYLFVHVEKKQDDRWIYIRHHMGCPCDAKCRRKPIKLGPGECKTHRYSWDKKNGECENTESGTYRFVFLEHGEPGLIGKSCEFEIH